MSSNEDAGKFGVYAGVGYVYSIGETKTFGSGFTVRDLVLCEGGDDENRNFVKLQGRKDLCEKIGTLHEGDLVRVSFFINGRKWLKPGETKPIFFCNNNISSIEVLESVAPAKEGGFNPDEQEAIASVGTDDDLPF